MPAPNLLPHPFARTILDVHGDAGAEWLGRLPDLIADCAGRWSLAVQPPFGNLSYHYVAPAIRSDGTEAVLKLGVPSPDFKAEAEALKVFGGHGAVLLLDEDTEGNALLLERLRPGTTLAELADDPQATSIAAEVMRQLWPPVPPQHAFPSIADLAAGLAKMRRRFGGTTGPLPRRLVEEAEALFTELIASMAPPVLLHGDLHHGNILAARRQPWLAIDPFGVIGEPECEVGALLRNPQARLRADGQPGRTLSRRLDQLADELAFDRARLRGWGVAQAVLSAWWSLEDHGSGWEWSIACAEWLAAAGG